MSLEIDNLVPAANQQINDDFSESPATQNGTVINHGEESRKLYYMLTTLWSYDCRRNCNDAC